jgi:hypothetical protein
MIIVCSPITVAARSEEWTVLARWNAEIVGSRRGCLYCVRLFCVCVVLCVGSGLATGWSPSKESYRLCIGSRNWKCRRGPTKDCRAIKIIVCSFLMLLSSMRRFTRPVFNILSVASHHTTNKMEQPPPLRSLDRIYRDTLVVTLPWRWRQEPRNVGSATVCRAIAHKQNPHWLIISSKSTVISGEHVCRRLQDLRISQARNQRESSWRESKQALLATCFYAGSSETAVGFQLTTRRYISENRPLQYGFFVTTAVRTSNPTESTLIFLFPKMF